MQLWEWNAYFESHICGILWNILVGKFIVVWIVPKCSKALGFACCRILLCIYDSYDLMILVLNKCLYFCGQDHLFNCIILKIIRKNNKVD
jgi:hypothetical protein